MTDENRRVHVAAEVSRGREALRAARQRLDAGLLNDAVSRAYYAALHFALAAILTEGIDPKSPLTRRASHAYERAARNLIP